MAKNKVRYLLIKEETCFECKGNRVIEHPAWQQYFDEHWKPFIEKHDRPPTYEEDEAWWSGMGYHRKEIPPQEVECHVCDGTGIIYREIVSVDDVFSKLGALAELNEGENLLKVIGKLRSNKVEETGR